MNRLSGSILACTAVLALVPASCAAPGGADDRLTAYKPAPGVEAKSCLSLAQIRQSHVVSDSVIDFEVAGGDVWRNELPQRCPGLGFEKSFRYSTSLTRLCSVDIITVFRAGAGGIDGPSCGLGQFQKMVAADADGPAAETPAD